LNKLRVLIPHTHLEPIELDLHLPEFLHEHCSSDVLQEFLDTLVLPCINSLHMISYDYITREYDKRWEASSVIARDMILREEDIVSLRQRILRIQDCISQGLRTHAQLYARRTAPAILRQKMNEIQALREEVNDFTTDLQGLHESLNTRLKDYMEALSSVNNIVLERETHSVEARALLAKIRAFLAHLWGCL